MIALYSLFINSAGWIVDSFIWFMSPTILEQILDGSDSKHKQHGQHGNLLPERTDLRHPVQQHYEYEINIRDPVKLFKQILRKKWE